MDYFESLIKTILEYDGYWVRQSHKANLNRDEKERIGKPTMPRPEIDLLAFKPVENKIVVYEVKSFLNSTGVKADDLKQEFDIPTGRYKLFTCKKYRNIVFDRIKKDMVRLGMCNEKTVFVLGLAAGNVHQSRSEEIEEFFKDNGWCFYSPEMIKEKVTSLAATKYENDPAIITAKVLLK